MTRRLTLPLKAIYFDQIASGDKVEEYRLATHYWALRLEGRTYDEVVVTKGYPARDDTTRRLVMPWRGFERKKIEHPHFGMGVVDVYAIRVGEPFLEG